MYPLALLLCRLYILDYPTSSVIAGMRGAKAGVSPPRPSHPCVYLVKIVTLPQAERRPTCRWTGLNILMTYPSHTEWSLFLSANETSVEHRRRERRACLFSSEVLTSCSLWLKKCHNRYRRPTHPNNSIQCVHRLDPAAALLGLECVPRDRTRSSQYCSQYCSWLRM